MKLHSMIPVDKYLGNKKKLTSGMKKNNDLSYAQNILGLHVKNKTNELTNAHFQVFSIQDFSTELKKIRFHENLRTTG